MTFIADILSAFAVLLALAILLLSVLAVILIATTSPYAYVKRYPDEKKYLDDEKLKKDFPSFGDKSSIHLSVVVPAYNEETRLKPMLDECLEHLEKRNPNFKYEVIVVSDGSSDSTTSVAYSYTKKYGSNKVRVLNLVKNRGKGGAIRLGVFSSRGAVILFADADGATKFEDIEKLEESLVKLVEGDYKKEPSSVANKLAIVCGSRAHLEETAIASRSAFRTFLMYGFHFVVWLFAVRQIKDTQCGFKMLTREAARQCFSSMHIERWAFDAELLYIAQRLNIPISEVAVNWTEIEGSKLVPVWSWLQMGKDLFLLWFKYRIGAWKLTEKAN